MRRISLIAVAAVWVCSAAAQQTVPLGISPFEPAGTGGFRLVDQALVKLASHRRLLIVGAHPDDEDTTLLALVGSGLGGEAAYLSLSRGEGGQNLIGPELGIGLGLIRTGELMAARHVEGTRQFFTRAYDFGYTRSLDETFDRWPRAVLLEDAVRVVRRFKPQVVVAIFPSDSRAGHGQHRAAGVIAEDLFEHSGSPDRYPKMSENGLPPWQPQVLYRRAWWDRTEASFEFSLDQVEPFSGRSILQIAGASRSKHRSQDMGTLQRLGSRQVGMIWVAGETASDATELFGGVDTSLGAIADHLPEGDLQSKIRGGLEKVAAIAVECRSDLSPSRASDAISALGQIILELDDLLDLLGESVDRASAGVVEDLILEKREVAGQALATVAGVAVDAVSDRREVGIGDSLTVTATVWNSGNLNVEVENVELETRGDWPVLDQGQVERDEGVEDLDQWGFEVRIPVEVTPTRPYFLTRPLSGDLYDWSDVAPAEQGEPIQRAPVMAVFDLSISETPVRIRREVVHRIRDQAQGEVRQPIRVLPEIEVSVTPSLMLWPDDSREARQVEILVQSRSPGPIEGELKLTSDPPLILEASHPFRIEESGGHQVLRFELSPPSSRFQRAIRLSAMARMPDDRQYMTAYPLVSYPHIRSLPMPVTARAEIQMLDLTLPEDRRIGYVRGASDRVPEVLQEIGLSVEMLSDTDLRITELARFDVIVVGSRAYESNPVLSDVNNRLLRFAQEGGLLIIQYQQYQFVRGGYAPFSLDIDRPHGRVTDENAPIQVLVAEHPVFRSPNRIGSEDWSGWIQERGLYFASSWDPAFTPLLALQDEGLPLEQGALLIAELGKGTYVYTGLSFFRQLPAGVPGAIRLFVNLLSLERS